MLIIIIVRIALLNEIKDSLYPVVSLSLKHLADCCNFCKGKLHLCPEMKNNLRTDVLEQELSTI